MANDACPELTVPLVTPVTTDGIEWDAFDRVLDHVRAGGVDAVFPCGTTGEVASLSRAERTAVIERTVADAPADVTVLAGGTGTAISDARAWLETVAAAGADIGVVTAPYFHPSNSPAGMQRFFEELADGSPLPLVLYNIPSCVGEGIPVEVVEELATHPEIVGLKDSSGDLAYGLRVLASTPAEFAVLQGYDPLLVPALRMGFDGGVNALANVFPEAYRAIVDSPDDSRARDLHYDVVAPLFDACRTDGFAAATKAALVACGVIDSSAVRPPLASVDPARLAAVVDRAAAAIDA